MFVNFDFDYEAFFEDKNNVRFKVHSFIGFWKNRGILNFKNEDEKIEWVKNICDYAEPAERAYLDPLVVNLVANKNFSYIYPIDLSNNEVQLKVLEKTKFEKKFGEKDKHEESTSSQVFIKAEILNSETENQFKSYDYRTVFCKKNSDHDPDNLYTKTLKNFFRYSENVIIHDQYALENLFIANSKKSKSGLKYILSKLITPATKTNLKELILIYSWPNKHIRSLAGIVGDKYNDLDFKKLRKYYQNELKSFLSNSTLFYTGGNYFRIKLLFSNDKKSTHSRYFDFDGHTWSCQNGIEFFGEYSSLDHDDDTFSYNIKENPAIKDFRKKINENKFDQEPIILKK